MMFLAQHPQSSHDENPAKQLIKVEQSKATTIKEYNSYKVQWHSSVFGLSRKVGTDKIAEAKVVRCYTNMVSPNQWVGLMHSLQFVGTSMIDSS